MDRLWQWKTLALLLLATNLLLLAGGWTYDGHQDEVPDSNERMHRLLERSEDLRQQEEKWQREWYPEKFPKDVRMPPAD